MTTSSPNPNWKPGDTIHSPVENMVTVDPANSEPVDMYKLIIGSVVPRPIAFVSTISESGVSNLAPFSFFNGVSSNPPCIIISVGRGRGDKEEKDTLRNILETRQFVVNSANEWLIEPLVHSAGEFAYGVSEMEQVGLTPIPSERVRPERVKESAVQLECELYDHMKIGDGSPGSSTLVIGKVVLFHVFDKAYQNGRILFDEIKPIGRLGGYGYGKVTETFNIPVPDVSQKKGIT